MADSVGQPVIVKDPQPSRQIVEQRIRNRIIEYFDLAASYDEQIDYPRKVPAINIANEVINQWEDWVPPPSRASLNDFSVFSPEELTAINSFWPVWEAAARALAEDFPSLAAVHVMPEWKQLRDQAQSAASVFQERGLLPED